MVIDCLFEWFRNNPRNINGVKVIEANKCGSLIREPIANVMRKPMKEIRFDKFGFCWVPKNFFRRFFIK